MSKSQDIKRLVKQIEKHKVRISAEREKMREIYDNLSALLDSLDYGIEEFENGIEAILCGIDRLSEYL